MPITRKTSKSTKAQTPASAVVSKKATQPMMRGKCTCCVRTYKFERGVCPVCESEVVPIKE